MPRARAARLLRSSRPRSWSCASAATGKQGRSRRASTDRYAGAGVGREGRTGRWHARRCRPHEGRSGKSWSSFADVASSVIMPQSGSRLELSGCARSVVCLMRRPLKGLHGQSEHGSGTLDPLSRLARAQGTAARSGGFASDVTSSAWAGVLDEDRQIRQPGADSVRPSRWHRGARDEGLVRSSRAAPGPAPNTGNTDPCGQTQVSDGCFRPCHLSGNLSHLSAAVPDFTANRSCRGSALRALGWGR
jgi:hypothetical protein